MEELRGRNALLTGAAGGLGGYIARALAEQGTNLVLSDLPEAPLDELVSELRARGVAVETVAADLASSEEARELFGRAEEALGPVDILVNNAGLEFAGHFDSLTPEQIDTLVRVNLVALMLTTHAALPQMRGRGRGHVVNIASMAGKIFAPYLAPYTASKHGVVGFTHALRTECGSEPIGFSVICPVFISRVGMYGRLEDQVPDPPPGFRPRPPEDVGAAVVRAIRENRAEIHVANPALRSLVALGALAPRVAARMTRTRQMQEFGEDFSEIKERSPGTPAEERVASKER